MESAFGTGIQGVDMDVHDPFILFEIGLFWKLLTVKRLS